MKCGEAQTCNETSSYCFYRFIFSNLYLFGWIQLYSLPVSSVQGKAIGVGIGCILGMFPLLFFKDDEKKEGQNEMKENTSSPPAPTESSKN